MEKKLERKIVFAAKFGADSWDDLVHELEQIIFELRTKQETIADNSCITGGYGCGGTYAYKINPSQTHDNYFVEINEWLDEHKKESE